MPALRVDVVRRNFRVAVAVAEPDRVAVAEHHVVGAGSALGRLVVVVAHRVAVGELLQIGRVALLDVVEAHRGRAFAGRRMVNGGLRRAVGARADRRLSTQGNRSDRQPQPLVAIGGCGVAVELLPHLEEAMHRARRIGVVGVSLRVRELIGSGLQIAGVSLVVCDARVWNLAGLAGAASQKILVVVGGKTVFEAFRNLQIGRADA